MTKWGPILVDGKFVHHTDRETARCGQSPSPSPDHALLCTAAVTHCIIIWLRSAQQCCRCPPGFRLLRKTTGSFENTQCNLTSHTPSSAACKEAI